MYTGTGMAGVVRIRENGWSAGKSPFMKCCSSSSWSAKSSPAAPSRPRRSAWAASWSLPGARPRPRSIRPGCSAARVPNCSATTIGAWLGSITPPDPSRMLAGVGGQMREQHGGRRGRHSGHAVMLGHPEPVIAQLFGADRQRRGVGQRLADGLPDAYAGQVQHGQQHVGGRRPPVVEPGTLSPGAGVAVASICSVVTRTSSRQTFIGSNRARVPGCSRRSHRAGGSVRSCERMRRSAPPRADAGRRGHVRSAPQAAPTARPRSPRPVTQST